jgi:hypothetical protein
VYTPKRQTHDYYALFLGFIGRVRLPGGLDGLGMSQRFLHHASASVLPAARPVWGGSRLYGSSVSSSVISFGRQLVSRAPVLGPQGDSLPSTHTSSSPHSDRPVGRPAVVRVQVHRVLETRVRVPETSEGSKMADPEVTYIFK